jgi:isoleucyl-tRNA synthetase
MECVRSLDAKFKKKNVLLVSHGDPLRYLRAGIDGFSDAELATMSFEPRKAEVIRLGSPVLPYNDEGRLDVHRPYIDRIVLRDPKTKKELYRVKEVCDVWFDSGAMPYAQSHYPFDTSKGKPQKIDFPADYICEGIDQTRGWFYTLLAIATLLKREAPYKNVICTGLIHDKNGLKMSKSKGNVISPLEVTALYGTDALRMGLVVGNTPGTDLNLDPRKVGAYKKFANKVWNVARFVLSEEKSGEIKPDLKEEFDAMAADVTKDLVSFRFHLASEKLYHYVWDRFAAEIIEESKGKPEYSATLYYLLENSLKLLHPFMPFVTEEIWQSLPAPTPEVGAPNRASVLMVEKWPTN